MCIEATPNIKKTSKEIIDPAIRIQIMHTLSDIYDLIKNQDFLKDNEEIEQSRYEIEQKFQHLFHYTCPNTLFEPDPLINSTLLEPDLLINSTLYAPEIQLSLQEDDLISENYTINYFCDPYIKPVFTCALVAVAVGLYIFMMQKYCTYNYVNTAHGPEMAGFMPNTFSDNL